MSTSESSEQRINPSTEQDANALLHRVLKIGTAVAGAVGGLTFIFSAIAAGKSIAYSNAQETSTAMNASYDVQQTFYNEANHEGGAALEFGITTIAMGAVAAGQVLVLKHSNNTNIATPSTMPAGAPPEPPVA